jgi:hypothetical protein
MVTGLNAGYAFADRFNDARAFMAGDDRQGVLGGSGHQMPITMADTGGGDLDQDFSSLWRLKVKGFDLEWDTGLVEDGRFYFHGFSFEN